MLRIARDVSIKRCEEFDYFSVGEITNGFKEKLKGIKYCEFKFLSLIIHK